MQNQNISFTPKQLAVKEFYFKNKIRHLVLDGSVGSGKTNILVKIFMLNVYKQKNKRYNFIIGGATIATIKRNFIGDMERILGKEIKVSQDNRFKLFGNTIHLFEGMKNDAWKKVRGMNSAGSMLGEMTTLNRKFVKEVEARTRVADQFLLSDTNPDSTLHWVKKEYIDRSFSKLSSGSFDIVNFNFCIDDNTFLSEDYKQSLRNSYPVSTALYERNIMGRWTDESEASIYGKYLMDIIYFTDYQLNNLYVGIDLGISDSTSLTFGTMGMDGKLYILHNYINHGLPTQHYIDYIQQYCRNVNFYSANINIVLPHDSAKREDAIQMISTRYYEYLRVFPNTHRLSPIRVVDMINNTRKHLWNKRVMFYENVKDFISNLRAYSWKVRDGVIDNSIPEHGTAWDSPSNIVDSFEYLVFFTLGFDKNDGSTVEYNRTNNREYTKNY